MSITVFNEYQPSTGAADLFSTGSSIFVYVTVGSWVEVGQYTSNAGTYRIVDVTGTDEDGSSSTLGLIPSGGTVRGIITKAGSIKVKIEAALIQNPNVSYTAYGYIVAVPKVLDEGVRGLAESYYKSNKKDYFLKVRGSLLIEGNEADDGFSYAVADATDTIDGTYTASEINTGRYPTRSGRIDITLREYAPSGQYDPSNDRKVTVHVIDSYTVKVNQCPAAIISVDGESIGKGTEQISFTVTQGYTLSIGYSGLSGTFLGWRQVYDGNIVESSSDTISTNGSYDETVSLQYETIPSYEVTFYLGFSSGTGGWYHGEYRVGTTGAWTKFSNNQTVEIEKNSTIYVRWYNYSTYNASNKKTNYISTRDGYTSTATSLEITSDCNVYPGEKLKFTIMGDVSNPNYAMSETVEVESYGSTSVRCWLLSEDSVYRISSYSVDNGSPVSYSGDEFYRTVGFEPVNSNHDVMFYIEKKGDVEHGRWLDTNNNDVSSGYTIPRNSGNSRLILDYYHTYMGTVSVSVTEGSNIISIVGNYKEGDHQVVEIEVSGLGNAKLRASFTGPNDQGYYKELSLYSFPVAIIHKGNWNYCGLKGGSVSNSDTYSILIKTGTVDPCWYKFRDESTGIGLTNNANDYCDRAVTKATSNYDQYPGTGVAGSMTITQDTDYYPSVKQPYTYTVTFNGNGGIGTMAMVQVSSTDDPYKYTVPSCGFTPPTNKTFEYWVMSDGDDPSNFGHKSPGDQMDIPSNSPNAYLTAHWLSNDPELSKDDVNWYSIPSSSFSSFEGYKIYYRKFDSIGTVSITCDDSRVQITAGGEDSNGRLYKVVTFSSSFTEQKTVRFTGTDGVSEKNATLSVIIRPGVTSFSIPATAEVFIGETKSFAISYSPDNAGESAHLAAREESTITLVTVQSLSSPSNGSMTLTLKGGSMSGESSLIYYAERVGSDIGTTTLRVLMKVTFNTNSDVSAPSPIGVMYNKSYGAYASFPNTLNRRGYRFLGWNTKSNGTGVTVDSSTIVSNAANHTLYAQWSTQIYNEIYNVSVVTNISENKYYEVNKGSSVSLSVSNITAGSSTDISSSGLTFNGWYRYKNGIAVRLSTASTYNLTPSEDMTVYMHWTKSSSGGGYDTNKPMVSYLKRTCNGITDYMDLPIIESIDEMYQSTLFEKPTIIYGYKNNFVMDLGTRRNITVTVSRVQPKSWQRSYDSSSNPANWSNGFWVSQLRDFLDFWQNNGQSVDPTTNELVRTGGMQLYLSPNPVGSIPDDRFYETINKNVFMSGSLTVQYSSKELQKVTVSIPLVVARMMSNDSEGEYITITYKSGNALSKTTTTNIPKDSYFTIPACPSEWATDSLQTFQYWMDSSNNRYEANTAIAGFSSNVTLTAKWTTYKEVIIWDTPGTMTKTPSGNWTSGKVIMVGGGGSGAAGVSGTGAAGGGGSAGQYVERMIRFNSGTSFIGTVGAGGTGSDSAEYRNGEDGGTTILTTPTNAFSIAAVGGKGALSYNYKSDVSNKGASAVDSYGGSGGDSGYSTNGSYGDGQDGNSDSTLNPGAGGKGGTVDGHGCGGGGGGAAPLNITVNSVLYRSLGGSGKVNQSGSDGQYGGGGGGGRGGPISLNSSDEGIKAGDGGSGLIILLLW